jgi:exodeoxyribonuclease III
MISIATWNVNSVRQRIEHLLSWLAETKTDIVCLQEIKTLDEGFPRSEIEALGYNVETLGQKTFNGVAILSKLPFDEVLRGLPGDPQDEQARYIEGVFSLEGRSLRVASIYLPNGNPVPGDKYDYKLAFMDRLIAHAGRLLAHEELLVLAGDYNVIPAPRDAKDPAAWVNDALFLPASRAKFQQLLNLGLTEAFRSISDEPGHYSFWDYQAGAWQRNNGIRIDHLLLSPEAASYLADTTIHMEMRGREKPSDHVPVGLSLAVA